MKRDRINLMPKDQQRSSSIALEPLLAGLAGVIFVGLLGVTVMEYRSMRQRENVVMVETQKLDGLKREIASLLQDGNGLQQNQRLTVAKTLFEKKMFWSEVLKELSLLAPRQAWLVNIEIKAAQPKPAAKSAAGAAPVPAPAPAPGAAPASVAPVVAGAVGAAIPGGIPAIPDERHEILITGEAPSQASVSEYFLSLERSYYFRNVTFKYAEQMEDTNPRLYRFQFETWLPKDAFMNVAGGRL
ncbi:MAG: PilN domain-containing protein [Bdellovibrionaceae bacterium]|nr:PilN domain-containing protein [Pseudobdellovibrionaceae bacterium]